MFDLQIEGIEKIDRSADGIKKAREVISDLIYKACGIFGERATATVKEKHLSGGAEKLKVRTGRLRASIKYLVIQAGSDTTISMGTDVPYAAIHEFGGQTSPHIIEPRKKSVLHFMKNGQSVFAAFVRHPGSHIRARPFLQPGSEEQVPWLRDQIGALLERAAAEGLSGS